jgi:hypothetical protein
VEHPDWTDKDIAKAAGCSRQTLYTWPRYKASRGVMKEEKRKMPRGSKTAEGDVEAWDGDWEK